jgi:hypothetical protein
MADKGDINPATGKAYAINPATGVWDDNYWANVVEPGLKGIGSTGSASTGSIVDMANQLRQSQISASQPAISSLQASIPEIQSQYNQTGSYLQGQVGNLQSRYDALLKSLTNQQTQETTRTANTMSQQLGARGISSQGSLYGQTMNNALNPINENYASQFTNAQLNNESNVASLMNQIAGNTSSSVAAQRAVQNAIANLQSGGSIDAVTQAMNLYKLQNPQAQQTTPTDRYLSIGNGLYDTQTGQIIGGSSSSSSSGGYSIPTDYYAQNSSSVPSYAQPTSSVSSTISDIWKQFGLTY